MSERFIPENTQRALDAIGKQSHILDDYGFYLGGGTALSLRLKYRVSYDLDFFTPSQFDPQTLLIQLKNEGFVISESEISFGTLKFYAFETNFSFFYYPYKLIEEFENYEQVHVASVLDIALMKITAIGDRGLEKDFTDLYYSADYLKGLDVILDKFKDKFPDANFLHYLKGLMYFDDALAGPKPDIIVNNYDFAAIRKYFEDTITKYIQERRLRLPVSTD
jgi:hypothetical protein